MARIINSLAEVSADYDVLFCDLWGCVHNGLTAWPAAVAALQAFRAQGGKVCLMTNAPRPAAQVVAGFPRMGIPRDAWDEIVTSGDAAQDAMFAGVVGRDVWHCGPAKDDAFFDVPAEWQDAPPIRRVPLDEAQGIVCTGLIDEDSENPEDYREPLQQALDAGLPLLCANPDIVVDMGERRLWCAGALAQMYREMGGTSLYFGKPHAPIYDLARRRLALAPDARELAVGDGIHTDIAGAVDQGIDSIFISGGLAAADLGNDVETPDPELLEGWLKAEGVSPTYVIGRLR